MILSFQHPEPQRQQTKIFPVFLPFQGCPGRCTYCSQHLQTGHGRQSLSARLNDLAAALEARKREKRPPIGLGFFGGTFTAIPREWMRRFLELGAAYKQQGVISHIRCSTRPDALTRDMLADLARAGLDMIELGIQSFDQNILDQARRHYDRTTALTACVQVQQTGLELGLQMLPGLPGHTRSTWEEDIRECCRIQPDLIRLYPCLVVEGTVLAAWFRQGRYQPLEQEEALTQLTWAVKRLWARDIPVIRMGLTPEPQLLDKVVAGPWHPSLGNMVRSRLLATLLEEQVRRLGRRPHMLTVPQAYSGELWGYRKANLPRLEAVGITRQTVRYTQETTFRLQ